MKIETKICSVCKSKKTLCSFHSTGRKRKTDGIMPLRAACTTCERRKARKRHDIIRENRAIRKCPTCDNAMAANGCGQQVGLRENRARLHSDELLQFVLDFRAIMEHLPRPCHPLLCSAIQQSTIILNKVMGRRWAEKEKEIEDSRQNAAVKKNSAHHRVII